MKHEDKKSSDRPSMRRLSSLSSLASLTLFSRRRSSNILDSSSGSNLATNSQADSSPATGSNRDESAKPNKSFAARTLEKSTSWVLLPAPKGKLSVPRTRTMSQLPVAVRGHKPIDELGEHIPPDEVPIARPDRSKTPLRSRLPSLAKSIVKSNASRSFVKPVGPLVTSETEPLLGFPQLHRNRTSVAVNTSENDRPGRRTGLQTNGPTFVQPSRYSGQGLGPLHSNPNRPPMYKSRIAEPDTQASPAFGTPQSSYSPVNRSVDQPRHTGGSRSITHDRGKSLSGSAPMLKHGRSRTLTTSLLPLRHQATVDRLETGQEAESIEFNADPTHVFQDHPVAYWCGRFAALDDKCRNQMLDSDDEKSALASESREERQKRSLYIMQRLYSCCRTERAKLGLHRFHGYIQTMRAKAAAGDDQDLVSNITWAEVTCGKRGSFIKKFEIASHRLSDTGTTASSGTSYSTNSSKRISAIMDRLLGKARAGS